MGFFVEGDQNDRKILFIGRRSGETFWDQSNHSLPNGPTGEIAGVQNREPMALQSGDVGVLGGGPGYGTSIKTGGKE